VRLPAASGAVLGVVLCACGGHWPPVVETVSDVNRLPVSQRDVRCIGCGRAEVEAIAARLRYLDYLLLNTDSTVDDASITAVASIGTLRQLVISNASRVSDEGVSRLSAMPRLRELMLEDAKRLSDKGLLALARSKTLESLYVSGAPGVTEGAVRQLRRMMPSCSIRLDSAGAESRAAPPNNAMQLTRGGWSRMEALSSAPSSCARVRSCAPRS
jgi:hypothetical protein